MPVEVLMPKLGLTMTEGRIARWLVKAGEKVKAGQVLFEVENDKALNEIEAQADGVLERILLQEDEAAPVGAVIGYILLEGESVADLPEQAASKSPSEKIHSANKTTARKPKARQDPGPERKVSPAARRLAGELKVDLTQVEATGPGGRIVVDDVKRAAETAPEAEAEADMPFKIRKRVPLRSIRRVIAERMLASIQGSAQLTLTREVDVTEWVAGARALNEDRAKEKRISFDAMLAYQISRTIQDHPEINARLEEDEILQLETVNIGVAMDTPRGLMVPVIKDVADKDLEQIAADLRQLQEKVRSSEIELDDVTGGTFTLSNLGMFGIDAFTPILNPPECGVLGVGRIRPSWLVDEQSGNGVVRQTMILSLTFDHRLIDGAPAARFLADLTEKVEKAELS